MVSLKFVKRVDLEAFSHTKDNCEMMGMLTNSSGGAPSTMYAYAKLSHCALNVTILFVNCPSGRLGIKTVSCPEAGARASERAAGPEERALAR